MDSVARFTDSSVLIPPIRTVRVTVTSAKGNKAEYSAAVPNKIGSSPAQSTIAVFFACEERSHPLIRLKTDFFGVFFFLSCSSGTVLSPLSAF